MKLYHCKQSRSTRILWLLEELGVDYELETMPFEQSALKAPDYLSINPFGKVPALVDGAVSMFESVAITKYILDRYGDGRLQPPSDSDDYAVFLQWLTFGEATMMGPLVAFVQHSLIRPEDQRDAREREFGRTTFAHYAGVLNEELSDHHFLVGDEFTAADIVVGYTLHLARNFDCFPDDLPHLTAYYERLAARPAFVTATS